MNSTSTAALIDKKLVQQQKQEDEEDIIDDDDDDDIDPELQCSICLDFFHEPITLECNHSFCRLCLLQSTKQAPDGRSCPQCRALITNIKDLINHPIDGVISSKIVAAASSSTTTSISSEQIKERAKQYKKSLQLLVEQTAASIPVFIMGGTNRTSLGRRVNLHFFEPRYKILIRRAWEGNKQFLWVDSRPTQSGAPIHGLLVNVETARFLNDGRANIAGRCIERITYPNCWIEDGTQGLWYASDNNNNNNSNNNDRSSQQQQQQRNNTTSESEIEIPRGVTQSQTSNNNSSSARSSSGSSSELYGDREFPIFGFNGLSLNISRGTTTTKSFVLFEPRFLIMANECWTGQDRNGIDDQLLLCAPTEVPVLGQTVVLAKMVASVNLPGGGGGDGDGVRKRITLMGIREVTIRSVREDNTKQGLWYSQISTNGRRRGSSGRLFSGSSRRNSNNCTIS